MSDPFRASLLITPSVCPTTNTKEGKLRKPARAPALDMQNELKFYNAALHEAAFALPEFARRKIEEARIAGGFAPRVVV